MNEFDIHRAIAASLEAQGSVRSIVLNKVRSDQTIVNHAFSVMVQVCCNQALLEFLWCSLQESDCILLAKSVNCRNVRACSKLNYVPH